MDFSAICGFLEQMCIEHYFSVKTADLVSFKVGGIARVVIYPKTIDELSLLVRYLSNEKYVILGNGTNCYFTDELYNGAVIVTSKINSIKVNGEHVVAQCGAGLLRICKYAYENSLEGFEFAYGIPGTVGGAVCMNASAFGKSMSDIVVESCVVNIEDGRIYSLGANEHQFMEKHSIFREKHLCLLECTLKGVTGDKSKIFSKMKKYITDRRAKQPLNMHSAGSTFVKPQNDFASRLIDSAGLKGIRVGDAQVSNKHAGFVVNLGNAKSTDVKLLIEIIKEKIFLKFNVELKEEVIYIE